MLGVHHATIPLTKLKLKVPTLTVTGGISIPCIGFAVMIPSLEETIHGALVCCMIPGYDLPQRNTFSAVTALGVISGDRFDRCNLFHLPQPAYATTPRAFVLTLDHSIYPPCHTRLIFWTRLLSRIIPGPHDDGPDPKIPRRAASRDTWIHVCSGDFET